eukprot:3569185-Pyramimonas_sp.AAC.1
MRRNDKVVATDAELERMSDMRKLIKKVYCVPTGLGTRRASLGHKMHCLYHQLFLNTSSLSCLRWYCACVVSCTTDQGTEASICGAPPVRFQNVFPYFNPGIVDGEEDSDLDLPFGLQGSLQIPGGIHIIHNATKGCLYAMGNFDETHDQISAVA